MHTCCCGILCSGSPFKWTFVFISRNLLWMGSYLLGAFPTVPKYEFLLTGPRPLRVTSAHSVFLVCNYDCGHIPFLAKEYFYFTFCCFLLSIWVNAVSNTTAWMLHCLEIQFAKQISLLILNGVLFKFFLGQGQNSSWILCHDIPVVVWMRTGPIGSCIWIFSHQREELFERH